MNLKWTDTRNRCSPDLIKSELIVSINAREVSCVEFCNKIKQNKNIKKILEEVKSNQKY